MSDDEGRTSEWNIFSPPKVMMKSSSLELPEIILTPKKEKYYFQNYRKNYRIFQEKPLYKQPNYS